MHTTKIYLTQEAEDARSKANMEAIDKHLALAIDVEGWAMIVEENARAMYDEAMEDVLMETYREKRLEALYEAQEYLEEAQSLVGSAITMEREALQLDVLSKKIGALL